MSRLTLKNKDWACRLTTPMYNKLHDLEDIEERIDFDLIKAVELCDQVNRKKVVYTKEKWGIIDRIRIQDKLDIELLNHRLYSNSRGVYVSFDLHKYGKTWALTREELKDDK